LEQNCEQQKIQEWLLIESATPDIVNKYHMSILSLFYDRDVLVIAKVTTSLKKHPNACTASAMNICL
jgi:hypothetical protein